MSHHSQSLERQNLDRSRSDPLIGTSRWDRMPWQEGRKYIRRRLEETGTDVDLNDRDKCGDGDQSEVPPEKAQFYRDLFAHGGDINLLADVGMAPLSSFQKHCIFGNIPQVKSALEYASKKGPDSLTELLESRETAMRQSPLMMIVSIGKNLDVPHSLREEMDKNQVAVARLLLEYGARPDVRDVCGKTVCHYGMGCMATLNMTVKICDMCIEAWKSHYLCSKKVVLHGLESKPELNGRTAICKGYLADSGRRIVELQDDQNTLSIKPSNLKLCDVTEDKDIPQLYDIPDRIGMVCLLEVIMRDRKDIADLLLKKYHARLDIADCDGVSPASLSLRTSIVSASSGMVNQAGSRVARAQRKVERKTCANCGQVKGKDNELMGCSVCHSVAYCSKGCQVTHWKAVHKKECKKLAANYSRAVVLDEPIVPHQFSTTLNFQSRSANSSRFSKPSNIAVDEKFYIKVQANGPQRPIMIYDETRELNFVYRPGQSGFEEIHEAVSSEPTWQGRKAFMLASFDNDGRCTVYPGLTSIKKW